MRFLLLFLFFSLLSVCFYIHLYRSLFTVLLNRFFFDFFLGVVILNLYRFLFRVGRHLFLTSFVLCILLIHSLSLLLLYLLYNDLNRLFVLCFTFFLLSFRFYIIRLFLMMRAFARWWAATSFSFLVLFVIFPFIIGLFLCSLSLLLGSLSSLLWYSLCVLCLLLVDFQFMKNWLCVYNLLLTQWMSVIRHCCCYRAIFTAL